MKAYTDLEQSKKLAEILPIESSDMWFQPYPNDEYWYDVPNIGKADLKYNQLPCWSLAALLDILKYPSLTQDVENKWSITEWTGFYPKSEHGFDSPVDASVAMISELHKQKIL